MKNNVLIIHERAETRDLLADILVAGGYECATAGDGVSARRAMWRRRPNLVLLSGQTNEAGENCLGTLARLNAEPYPIPVLVIGIGQTSELGRRAAAMGASAVVERPWESVDLLRIAGHAIEQARKRRAAAESAAREQQIELVGSCEATARLKDAISRAANSDQALLIAGAMGTGKELAARIVHQESRRSNEPFVIVNCAALSADHVEEKLFGVDATDDRDNWAGAILGSVEQAEGGTLFVDAVETLPDDCQRKLLLYLLNGTFERAKGHIGIPADVRVIAATTRDLAAQTRTGAFREDLYHRLQSNCIRVPALAERRDDIPLLVRHFVKRISETARLPELEIDAATLTAWADAPWPGNIRELRNTVERLMIAAAATRGGSAGADGSESRGRVNIGALSPFAQAVHLKGNLPGLAAGALRAGRQVLQRTLRGFGALAPDAFSKARRQPEN